MHRPFLVACVCCLICRAGPAQQREFSAIPDAPSATQQSETGPEATNAVQSGVAMFLTLQKKSAVFPDLATARGPLSNWDKCKLAANNSVALSTIGGALLGSAFGQARTSPGGYGQELGGYGKRLGADMARAASYQVFGTCLLASTTHEDPRFYVKKQLDFRGSLKYAAVRLVITRNDSGAPAVNYSGLLGPLAGEALANTYYPPGSRGVGSTLIRYSADVGWRFGGYLLRQYWPLINRKLQLAPE
jgi:hypothetical protein